MNAMTTEDTKKVKALFPNANVRTEEACIKVTAKSLNTGEIAAIVHLSAGRFDDAEIKRSGTGVTVILTRKA